MVFVLQFVLRGGNSNFMFKQMDVQGEEKGAIPFYL